MSINSTILVQFLQNNHFKPFGVSGRIQIVLLLVEVGQKQRKGLAGMEKLGKGDVSVAPAKLKDALKELVVCIRNCCVYHSSIKRYYSAYFASWNRWGECSELCNGGRRDRSRRCIDGKLGEVGCEGDSTQEEDCNTKQCK